MPFLLSPAFRARRTPSPAILAVAAVCALLVVIPSVDAAPAAKKTTPKRAAPKSTASLSAAEALAAYRPPPPAPGDTILARVGNRFITLDDFRGEWERVTPDRRPKVADPVLARQLFLGDLITRDLFGVEATSHPRPLSAADQADIDSLWHIQARNQLFVEDVENKVTIDTTQVERYRTELSRILFLEAYLFPTREKAQAWYTRIVMGTPVSRLQAAAQAGGPDAPQHVDLGHKIREDFNDETSRTLFALAPGRLSPPVEAKEGWALIQVTRTRQRPNSIVYGGSAGVLREMRRIYANSYKEIYRDSLARAVHIRYQDVALDTLLTRFLNLPERTSEHEGGGMNYNMFQPLPRYLPGDSALVLATSDVGVVTGGDLYLFLKRMSDIARPEIRSPNQLRAWVDRVAFDQVLLRLALEKGYDKSPRVLQEVSRRREMHLVEALYADSVSSRVKLSDAEVRAYFAADSARWRVKETSSLWVCGAPSKAQADSLLQAARGGANLKEMAYKVTTLGNMGDNGGVTGPFKAGECPVPSVEDSALTTPAGAFGGPIAAPEGWIIFKVMERTPARMRSFEEAHDEVAQALRAEREEEATQAFLVRLRKRIPVESNETILGKVANVGS